ncbi:MAG: hypothetical protein IJI66_00825 [Erysipelotrichaceae bacterium]|nr:hypothetical protein [Erysipelotrichaceae bacterium]
MLVVKSPMLTEKVKQVLDGYQDNDIKICFVKQEGMSLYFEIEGIRGYEAIALTKKIIRSHDWGNSIYFGVSIEN